MKKFNVPSKITVDWLLNNVDLKFEGYVPSDIAFEFFNFIRLALGEEPENSNPFAHYFLIDVIFQQPNVKYYFEQRGIDYEDNKGRVAVLCTREFSKSTLIGTYLPLFIAWKGEVPGFGKVKYGLYIGDSMRNNVKTTMNTIETVFLESEWLLDQFESYRFTDELVELIRPPRTRSEIAAYNKTIQQGKKKEQVPGRSKRRFAMKGVGANTGTRGTRQALDRPQFAIFDDLVSSEADAYSEVQMDKIETTIDSDVLQALHGSGSFAIIIGTPYNKVDPVYSRVESGTWIPVVFPIAKELRLDLQKHEFEGVWEDRHSYEKVMRRYKTAVAENKKRNVMQELMLRISSEEDKLIPEGYIDYIKRSDVIRHAGKYNWYITTDFTTTGGQDSDYSGIAVFAVNSNNDFILVDLSLKKMEMSDQYTELFRLVMRYMKYTGNIEVGIETDGQQKAHIHAIKQMMASKNTYFTIARAKGSNTEGIRSASGGTKFERFKAGVVPLFQNGKILFVEEMKNTADMQELLTELEYATYKGFGSSHDDGCDLLTQITMMNVYPSSSDDVESHHYDPIWNDYEESEEDSSNLASYVV